MRSTTAKRASVPSKRYDHDKVIADIILFQQTGSEAAYQRIWKSVEPLCQRYITQNRSPRYEVGDLLQWLRMCVVHCARRFNPYANVRFITYFTRSMPRYVGRMRRKELLLHIPDGVQIAVSKDGNYSELPYAVCGLEEPLAIEPMSEGQSGWSKAQEGDFAPEAIDRVAILDAVKRLPKEDAYLLRLSLTGQTDDETARAHGVSRSCIQKRLGLINERLRQEAAENGIYL